MTNELNYDSEGIDIPIRTYNRRPCVRCGETFQKTGRNSKVCDNCNKMVQKVKNNKIKRGKQQNSKKTLETQYFKKKEQLDAIKDEKTLQNYKILSEAYKIGKKIWGTKFTVVKLSEDMDMPYTTVKRCLALDRANKSSWKLVDEGKISVFKLAMICALKSVNFQDEIVKIAIEDNLSTYQIKSILMNDIEDMNKERHRLAVENGYSRKDSAYHNFNNWIDRGKLFLLIKKDKIPESKVGGLKQGLEDLSKRIQLYLEVFE